MAQSKLQQTRNNLGLPQLHWKMSPNVPRGNFDHTREENKAEILHCLQRTDDLRVPTAPQLPSIETRSLILPSHRVLVGERSTRSATSLPVWAQLDPYWRSGVLGNHRRSEMLWELLSVTGSYTSIGPCTGRYFYAPHSCLHPGHWVYWGHQWDQSPTALLGHSKVGRAPCSPCSLGEYARKGLLVIWVGHVMIQQR